jgi:haloacetate dehalogenase
MLEGFTPHDIEVSETTIHAVSGGHGPPLLLLHGYPQTHILWRHVAPALAEHFTVVAADLRGYGQSGKPISDPGHTAYSKRSMARDMIEAMESLGFHQFFVAGHDRGGRVAYRMALDHPGRVLRLATLDIMPTYATWQGMRGTGGLSAFHWYFLAQPHDLPERLIGADPAYYLKWMLQSWLARHDAIEPEAFAAYEAAFTNPDTIRATCDDYRAGATIDVEIDRETLETGKKITCPMLVLWGDRDGALSGDRYLRAWDDWATDTRGHAIPGGHFLPEEAPDETTAALRSFFSEGA